MNAWNILQKGKIANRYRFRKFSPFPCWPCLNDRLKSTNLEFLMFFVTNNGVHVSGKVTIIGTLLSSRPIRTEKRQLSSHSRDMRHV